MKYETSPTCQIRDLPEIYEKYFGYKPDGTFIEVGAFDGLTYSNTYGLAELGWYGLYIEAVQEYAEQCRENHKYNKVQVVNACVGVGKLIHMFISGEYSTSHGDFARLANKLWDAKYNRTILMPSVKLDSIIKLTRLDSMPIDLLVVDVEGSEPEVLSGFSIDTYKPRMVIIEVHEGHNNKLLSSYAEPINDYFDRHGYAKVYSDTCNNIYVRR